MTASDYNFMTPATPILQGRSQRGHLSRKKLTATFDKVRVHPASPRRNRGRPATEPSKASTSLVT